MAEQIMLYEDFSKQELDDRLKWFSAPKRWQLNQTEGQLVIYPAAQTDFWQKTHYGFEVDNGHFLYYETNQDFRLTTKLSGEPVNRYDQAGLMVRYSADNWIKTSVEFIPDQPNKLGAVVTRAGYSDWSSQADTGTATYQYFRITKQNTNYYIDYSRDGQNWQQIRMAYLPANKQSAMIGVYACSPQGQGYQACFDFLKIEQVDQATIVY
ncbi:hypothetical protein SAMN04488134_10349 [Amphibacillus marinus]|uniref:DUF1349 domain-containing protein n=1 Tax=Amphibacillus marinus TaxID=872970 RepID=A0A1H8L1X5_9BACI|nr:DUF1349 domain-containing protein [Amphibacillus marinus]SEN99089.1 hypothetical protein SAMN04488134_10349 [Amphibacillus marinus]